MDAILRSTLVDKVSKLLTLPNRGKCKHVKCLRESSHRWIECFLLMQLMTVLYDLPNEVLEKIIRFTREDQQSWSNLIDLRRVNSMS
jgi:hypothetical protein